jgi:trigger factor
VKVEVRKEPQSRAVLEIELPPESVSQAIDRALSRLNQRYEIPGFRRGKAPKNLLERYLGRETVVEETVKLLVPDAYSQALKETGVRPIAQPEIQVETLEEGKPLRFVATVDLIPEVRLGDYRALRITPSPPSVTDADIDAALEDLRTRQAQLESTGSQPAARGDYVLVKAVDTASAERFLPGKEYLVEIGGGAYPAELEDALVGAVAGSRVTATLAGGASLVCEVVDVKRRQLPAVDDAFAKAAGGVESLQALREALRAKMEGEARTRARRDDEEHTVEALLEGTGIELPPSLVDHEVHHLVEDLSESLARRGLTLERYLQAQEKTDAQLREELRGPAERRLRTQLALDEVARTEGLEPTGEEIDREVENVARGLQQELARVREWLTQTGRLESLGGTLRRRKALAYLVSVARGDPGRSPGAPSKGEPA